MKRYWVRTSLDGRTTAGWKGDGEGEGGPGRQVALLGDLAVNLTGVGQLFNQKPNLVAFVREAEQSGDARLAEQAEWANNVITKAMSG